MEVKEDEEILGKRKQPEDDKFIGDKKKEDHIAKAVKHIEDKEISTKVLNMNIYSKDESSEEINDEDIEMALAKENFMEEIEKKSEEVQKKTEKK